VEREADARPIVICSADGKPIDLAHENEKGHKKSLEQGHLWVLHEETGRLLPYRNDSKVRVEDHGGWYQATLLESGEPRLPDDSQSRSREAAATAHAALGEGAAESVSGNQNDFGSVAAGLASLILERKRQMPEGSYTTHLFSSGAEKIRKKLGEEAVELILAPDRDHLVSETADLIYHLLVLLASEGITLADVASALEKR